MWVRGLKQIERENYISAMKVAPYVGAWIETDDSGIRYFVLNVAPYVGAWIETLYP